MAEARRAAGDVRPLVEFRLARLRGRSRRVAWVAGVVVVVSTLAAATAPAFVSSAAESAAARDVKVLLPTAYLAFLLTTTLAIIAAAGGRELLPRAHGISFPISPTTDHLGALMLAPLNIAWILQAWSLMGVTAYVVAPSSLWTAQLSTLGWIFFATAFGQLVAWCVEWLRRLPGGVHVVRAVGALLVAGAVVLVMTGRVTDLLDRSPVVSLVLAALAGGSDPGAWALGTAALLACGLLAVAAGACVAHAVARRQPREEMYADVAVVASRVNPRSELQALVRLDRASVWRSVALRRGFAVLALMPGAIAAAGRLEWAMLPVLPGLVAAGGALLFGVNAWALDGVGALWRDSLPVRPQLVFAARVWVLGEVLLIATALTLVVAGLRAEGLPTSAELAAPVATLVVVSLQVVARSMHWSVRRPFAMDLTSARATPAPPLAMVGYSAHLALTSTLTGMVFSTTAQADGPRWALLLAVPFVLAAVRRLLITSREWATPEVHGRVIATVASR